VNYDVPTSPDSYVHRIGRVGRAGREGVAITLADPRESRLLRVFERQVKGRIEVAQVPTVADLRARRLELTRAALREAILAGGLDRYRVAVESLAQEHDLMDIALAAVKLAHQAGGRDGEDDDGTEEFEEPRPAGGKRAAHPEAREDGGDGDADTPGGRRGGGGRTSRVYVGAGRSAGIRPQDLVGAIAGESGIQGKQIGAIEIYDKYAIVELPEEVVEDVLRAMRRSPIKGRKVTVRRFVEK